MASVRGFTFSSVLRIFCGFCIVSSCSQPPDELTVKPSAGHDEAARGAAPSSGRVVGKVTSPPAGIPVIIVLDPKSPREFPPPTDTPVMDQVSQTFGPSLLFVRTNQQAEFRNSDDTLHNVHVTHEDTREPQFNVAIPTGEVYRHAFKRDGFYHVGCDIHPAMSAEIFASSSPYVAMAEEDGSFAIDDVQPGAYVATVYAGSKRTKRDIDVNPGVTNVDIG